MEVANNKEIPSNLEETLKELAAKDWPAFVALVGPDCITKAKVCLLSQRGKSLGQIANALRETKEFIRWTKKNKCSC